MKYKLGWIGIFSAVLAACSSTPSRVTVIEARDRAEFVKAADSRLNDWEKEAGKKTADRNRQMMAVIRDTRAEVRNMELAPSADWEKYRPRIQTRFERIDRLDREQAE